MVKHAGVLRSLRTHLRQLEVKIADWESSLEAGREKTGLSSLKRKLVDFQETAQSEVMHIGKYAVARVYGGARSYAGNIVAPQIRNIM
ncbi:hypothetical protein NDU88_010380 [Pleurodeles waltl]|uniref:Uncharacterized protein n=1 Tax=Pleurodeles waltl TaxID=8319 RepID=A0AAV7S180_PLEWA|nr:hypothetical protein NDU88_010380 [Pleurodeles waltl]